MIFRSPTVAAAVPVRVKFAVWLVIPVKASARSAAVPLNVAEIVAVFSVTVPAVASLIPFNCDTDAAPTPVIVTLAVEAVTFVPPVINAASSSAADPLILTAFVTVTVPDVAPPIVDRSVAVIALPPTSERLIVSE